MFTVYDGIDAYARKANSGLYIASRTAIFNNPADQIYTPKGKVTRIRQYESGMAGNYDKSKGWMTSYGTGKGVEWIDYRAEFDRAKILSTDAIDEEQSFAVGMVPSIELLNSDFLDNQLPREIDATNIAKFYSRVPDKNRKLSTSDYKTTEDHILRTLSMLEADIFDSGYDGETVLFMTSKVYANFQNALIKNMALASGALIDKKATVVIDTGLGSLISGADSTMEVDISFKVYSKFLIMVTPADRMYTKILMLSGNPDEAGQESGGYIADYMNPEFGNIELLAIPKVAAFTNTRYMVDNFLYPSYLQNSSYTKADVREINKRMYGNVEIANAGINQKANAFEYNIRAIYGGDIFDNRARNCFAVTGALAPTDIPVTDIKITGADTAEVGNTVSLTATLTPTNATEKTVTWTIVSGEEYADVVNGEVTITSGEAGDTIEVKAEATGGDSIADRHTITII